MFDEVIEKYKNDKKQNDRLHIGQKRKAEHMNSVGEESTQITSSASSNDRISTATNASSLVPNEKRNNSINTISTGDKEMTTTPQGKNLNEHKRTHDEIALGLEDDEQILAFLHNTHHGNIQRAKFYMLSHLCQGRGKKDIDYFIFRQSMESTRHNGVAFISLPFTAVKIRRQMKKIRKENEMDVPLSAVLAPLSDSWRRRYERFFETSTILGDHRNTNQMKNDYPYFDSKRIQKQSSSNGDYTLTQDLSSKKRHESDLNPWALFTQETKMKKCNNNEKLDRGDFETKCEKRNNNGDSHPDRTHHISSGEHDLKGYGSDQGLIISWKSVLKMSHNFASQLTQSSSPSKRTSTSVKLQELLIVLARAYSLPKPEDVFGRRDSISKQISQNLNVILDNVEFARGVLAHICDSMHENDEEGIDIQKLSKIVDFKSSKCCIRVEEIEIVKLMLQETQEWESKLSTPIAGEDEVDVSENLNLPQQSLAKAEELAVCGRSLSLRPQSLSVLDERIQRAYELRNRIREWTFSKVSF